jgi:hypothetical protein
MRLQHLTCFAYATIQTMKKTLEQPAIIKQILNVEHLFATIVIVLFFVQVTKYEWWWLGVLFPIVDVSMVGYLISKSFGAFLYNIGHSVIGPTMLVGMFVLTGSDWALFVSLIWLFHIFADRTLGYGLKHSTGFEHTHLGHIGKSAKK